MCFISTPDFNPSFQLFHFNPSFQLFQLFQLLPTGRANPLLQKKMTVTDNLAGCDLLVQMSMHIDNIMGSSRQKKGLDAALTQGNHVLESGLPAVVPQKVNVVIFNGGMTDPRAMFTSRAAAIEDTFQAPLFVLYIAIASLEDFVIKLEGLDMVINSYIKFFDVKSVHDLPPKAKDILISDHQEALDLLRIDLNPKH